MAQTASMVIAVPTPISIMIAWAVGRSVVKPLTSLKERMASLSQGQLEATVAHADRRDEIGEMARTVQVFRDAMLETNRMREEQVVAEKRQVETRKVDMNRLADQFEREVGEIIELVSVAAGQLEKSSTTLSKTADTVAQVSSRASTASNEASANVHSVAAASEELASSIGEIPPGRDLGQDRGRGRQPGAEDRHPHQRAVAGSGPDRRRRRSHPEPSPARPICWR